MQSLEALETFEKTVSGNYGFVYKYENFLPKIQDRILNDITENIREKFEVDYSKKIEISQVEMNNLKNLIVDFLKYKKNNFNTHYIQLLAWHIDNIKIMNQKTKFAIRQVSFLEYSPNPLLPFTITNKIFQLFEKPNIAPEMVSTALLWNYLENYQKASSRFKNVLKRYLKSIKYAKNVDIYFNPEKLKLMLKNMHILFEENGKGKDYLQHFINVAGMNQKFLKTEYFKHLLKSINESDGDDYGK